MPPRRVTPSRPAARRLTAVGCHIFAGGFTVGVRQAGFDVLCHLEGEAGYGATTTAANMPGLKIHVGADNWPVGELSSGPRIDFVYGNPPCAAWSGNNPNSHVEGKWRDDPRVGCVREHFSLLEELRPRVWAWESVCQAPVKGRELVDELTQRALAMGYSVTEVFHDARWLGTPQTRKRWFMVCHDVEVDFVVDRWVETSAVDALARVEPEGEPAYDSMSNRAVFGPHLSDIPAGKRLRAYWEEVICPPGSQTTKPNGHVLGRPGFGHVRLDDHGPATATVGYSMVHPTQHRFLHVNEVAALAGFPPGYVFDGGPSGAKQLDLIARGVCPPVGRWLAEQVRRGVEAGRRVTDPVVRVVDLRERPAAEGGRVTREPRRAVTRPPAVGEAKAAVPVTSPPQPTREVTRNTAKGRLGVPGSKPQDLNRRYDTTQLHETGHGQRVHRDYAAHFFRWGWASRFVKSKETRVLDVGCGQDLPLVKILTASLSTVPAKYVGVDLNKITRRTGISWVEAILDEFDFPGGGWEVVARDHGPFDLVSCFEVIEHMHKVDGERLLAGIRECMADGAKLLLSTPVYNMRKMAANHIHEWTVDELRESIEASGLRVVERFGTFASWNDIKRVCTDAERELVDQVGRFYGGDVLACFLAPKYPDASRNNAWVVEKA